MREKNAAYYEEVRRAVGRGAPVGLLGTSTKSLERSLAKLKAVQQAEEVHSSPEAPKTPGPMREAYARHFGGGRNGGTLPSRGVAIGGIVGYRGPTVCAVAGITYRQLDYWARTGLVEPSVVRSPFGVGAPRLYGVRDITLLKLVKRLLDAGISLQQIRVAVQHLRDRGTDDLGQVTLMSDGEHIYEATSPDEVATLLASGKGLFGIPLGRLTQEVAEELSAPSAVRAEDGLIAGTDDELAAPPPHREREA